MNKDSLADGISAHQLRAFTTVATTLSYARAADLLHYTQPGVYLQVKSFERLLGCKLFERSGRGLRLTQVGTSLLRVCQSALADLDRIEDIRREAMDLRRLTVAGGPVSGPYLLPVVVREFAREHPDILVDILIAADHGVVDCIAAGTADLAVGARLDKMRIPDCLRLTHLFDEPYFLVRSNAVSEVAARPALIYMVAKNAQLLRDVLEQVKSAGVNVDGIRSLPSVEAVKGACLSGRSYAFLAGPTVAAELQTGVFCRVEGFSAAARFWSCHPAVELMRDEVRTFLEFLHQYTAHLQESPARPWLEYRELSRSDPQRSA